MMKEISGTTWSELYDELWHNNMEFQIKWNYHCIQNNIYDLQKEYGDKAYNDLKNEFTELFIERRLS